MKFARGAWYRVISRDLEGCSHSPSFQHAYQPVRSCVQRQRAFLEIVGVVAEHLSRIPGISLFEVMTPVDLADEDNDSSRLTYNSDYQLSFPLYQLTTMTHGSPRTPSSRSTNER